MIVTRLAAYVLFRQVAIHFIRKIPYRCNNIKSHDSTLHNKYHEPNYTQYCNFVPAIFN